MKKTTSITILCLFVVMVLCTMTLPLHAQEEPSTEFTLYVIHVDISGTVRLAWTKPAGSNFVMYYIYRSVVPFPDSSNFTLIDSTQKMTFEDHLQNFNIEAGTRYAYYVVGKTMSGTLMQTKTVTVEIPSIPPQNAFHLRATVHEGTVELLWDRPTMPLSTPYTIYRIGSPGIAPLFSNLIDGDTVVLGTTADTSYTDIPPIGSQGRGYYTYFIRAKTTENVDIQSNLASVIVTGESTVDRIQIVSVPITTARVGTQYIYNVDAVSSDSTAVLRYSATTIFRFTSVNLQCDSITGVVTMTPDAKEIIPILVIVRSDKGGSATQEFEVKVSGINGVISGTVTDTLGQPIIKVLINVLKRDALMPFYYEAVTDSLGKYRITGIDRGTYLVHAIPLKGDYLDQWYNGKSSPLDATPIILDSIATVDFKLRSKTAQILPMFTVQGRVSDTLGLPISIPGTMVFFVNANFALNSTDIRQYLNSNHDIDFRFEGNSKFVYKKDVDSLGMFSLTIPAGSYIALAKASGYSTVFFKDKSYFLQADIIKLTNDTTGIDFVLSPLPPVALGSIGGQVLDTINNVVLRAHMIAFRGVWTFAPVDRYFIHSFFTETDSSGFYTFTDLPPGFYIILGIPIGNYAPIFYTDGSEKLRWDKATQITINGNSVNGINLYPHAIPDSVRGYTMIKGSVFISNTGTIPCPGALVYASQSDGDVAGYAVTDAEGKFVIDQLSPRSYTITADVPGYIASNGVQATPSYDALGNAVIETVSLSVQSPSSVETGTTTLPTKYVLNQNYPNPFNPTTRISFEVPARVNVTLIVYNILGQVVATLADDTFNAGKYFIDFNASQLASGVYLCRMNAGNFSSTAKMVLMR